MGLFATRRPASPGRHSAAALSDDVVAVVATGFEAVAEALADRADPLPACEAVGRELALDGASADEALACLRSTWRAVVGEDPSYDAVAGLVRAWSESTLAVVNHIGCEDPMTGLSSQAHLRSGIAALFRAQSQHGVHPRESHALVVVELVAERHGAQGSDPITRAMRMASLGEAARTVFAGTEVVARLGSRRVGVLADRDDRLGVRVRLMRRLLEGLPLGGTPRVWIEGLPASDLASGLLVGELARS